jgi:DNA-binding transcriptional regulator YiaG
MTSEEFKRQREAAGLTQAQLAGMIGVHPVTIARWETEMRRIPEMAARLLTLIVEQKRTERQSRRAKSSKSKRKG